MNSRKVEENFFKILMVFSLMVVIGSLLLVFAIVTYKGASALSISMITQIPQGGYYLGRGGGILNAIIGSLYLAGGALLLGTFISLPVAWYLNQCKRNAKRVTIIRNILDIACGIPSLIYGAFVFLVIIGLSQRTSLFWGIITVALFVSPILIRAMDEVMQTVSTRLKEASYSLGATEMETLFHVITRQALPGIISAIILAFGRAIGDAAGVLFTAGYTDSIPTSLSDPVATLPLAIFFQLSVPFPEVQARAYASCIVLLAIVLMLTIISRIASKKTARYVIK